MINLGNVKDSGPEIDAKMQEAITEKKCDLIVTSGGVSMGELDLIKPYIELKGEVFFGRLNMKPGKPTTFGRIRNTLLLALPGNPVSCFVTASLFLKPMLSILANSHLDNEDTLFSHHVIEAQFLPSKVKLDPIRPEYHRCTLY